MFETLQPAAYAVSFIFWALSTLTTCFRIYSRGWIIQAFGKDDWWMVMVLVCNTAQQGLFSAFLHYGGGIHLSSTTDPTSLLILAKLLFAEEIVYIWMQFAIKTGFLLFYLRLTNMTSFIYGVYATMGLNVLITIALWLLYCLQCMPLAAFWNAAAYPDAKCLPTSVTYYVPVALCILMDFIVLTLPIRPLWNIQATVMRRLGIIATITVGGIAVVVSCLRVIILHRFAVDPDFTYILGEMVIISAVELNVAIMASNVPSLKAVWLKHVSGSLKGTDHTSSVHLSSLGRKARPSERSELEVDPDSSSTNNLVTGPGSDEWGVRKETHHFSKQT